MNSTTLIPDDRARQRAHPSLPAGAPLRGADPTNDLPLIGWLAERLHGGGDLDKRRAAQRLLEEAFRAIDTSPPEPMETFR